jgi:hypothetical protein
VANETLPSAGSRVCLETVLGCQHFWQRMDGPPTNHRTNEPQRPSQSPSANRNKSYRLFAAQVNKSRASCGGRAVAYKRYNYVTRGREAAVKKAVPGRVRQPPEPLASPSRCPTHQRFQQDERVSVRMRVRAGACHRLGGRRHRLQQVWNAVRAGGRLGPRPGGGHQPIYTQPIYTMATSQMRPSGEAA